MTGPHPRPTDGELAILRVLWDAGPSTVRAVNDVLAAHGQGYTTTLKLMQIMADKGLVTRDASRRSHVYTAAASREAVQGSLVGELMDKAFGGSAAALVARALSATPASADELAEIQALIERIAARDDAEDGR